MLHRLSLVVYLPLLMYYNIPPIHLIHSRGSSLSSPSAYSIPSHRECPRVAAASSASVRFDKLITVGYPAQESDISRQKGVLSARLVKKAATR